jgi:hypothetical protein
VTGEVRPMQRWLPITVALGAATAEALGAGQLALYLLLAAVPIIAARGLTAFGELLDAWGSAPLEPVASLQALLYGVALLLLVAGAAAGSTAFALSGCLAVFALQALLGLGVELRRPALER